MAEIVPLPKQKRLRSLDEFEEPVWKARNRQGRVAFGLLVALAVAAGATGGLLLAG